MTCHASACRRCSSPGFQYFASGLKELMALKLWLRFGSTWPGVSTSWYQGTYPATGFLGASAACAERAGLQMHGGRRFRLIEVRGDWKQHVQVFRLLHFYTGSRICHQCKASRDPRLSFYDFVARPAWLATTRSHQEFLMEEIGYPINALIYTAKFHYTMIKYDSMHSVNLGCGLHANGSAFHELLKIRWWAQGERAVQFRSAFRSFREFVKRHHVESSQPVFKPWMLVTGGEEYCYFATKVGGFPNGHKLGVKILILMVAIPCAGLQVAGRYELACRLDSARQ